MRTSLSTNNPLPLLVLSIALASAPLLAGCPASEPEGTASDQGSGVADLSTGGSDLGMVVVDSGPPPRDMSDQGGPLPDLGGSPLDMSEQTDMCVDTTVYPDEDRDGYGAADGEAMQVCLVAGGSPPDGYQPQAGDCKDDDPLAHEMAEGICNDNVDDDCDGSDETCPTSQPDQMSVPTWDCTGTPPSNVYAWAKFADGGGYFQDGGCFAFFEGKKDIFYVTRHIFRQNSDPNCDKINGCVCPSLNGWPSYDRRLYAFSLRGDAADCDPISLRDHAGEEQAVSNSCRKYLYQMHFYDIPYSYISSSLEALNDRLTRFDRVEIACAEDAPHANLPFTSLLTTTIEYNPDFVKQ